jgi:hypothetical protein
MSFRGGFAIGQGYTLARRADDPSLNGGFLPGPDVPTTFTPPRETPWSVSGGWAIRVHAVEIGAGIAFAPHQTRWLVDARFGK